jgi:hypothetical protein
MWLCVYVRVYVWVCAHGVHASAPFINRKALCGVWAINYEVEGEQYETNVWLEVRLCVCACVSVGGCMCAWAWACMRAGTSPTSCNFKFHPCVLPTHFVDFIPSNSLPGGGEHAASEYQKRKGQRSQRRLLGGSVEWWPLVNAAGVD